MNYSSDSSGPSGAAPIKEILPEEAPEEGDNIPAGTGLPLEGCDVIERMCTITRESRTVLLVAGGFLFVHDDYY